MYAGTTFLKGEHLSNAICSDSQACICSYGMRMLQCLCLQPSQQQLYVPKGRYRSGRPEIVPNILPEQRLTYRLASMNAKQPFLCH